MNSRRDFLKKAIAGSAGLMAQEAFSKVPDSAAQLANQPQLPPTKEDLFDCIVIGGGMSGISAAKDLAFPAFEKRHKVVVLEASNRIGGRIFTVNDNRFGGPIEMGGTFLHVEPETFPIGNDIKDYGIKIKKIPRIFSGLLYYDGWEDDLKKEYQMLFQWKWTEMLTFARDIDSFEGPDMSAREWLNRKNYAPLGRGMVDLYFTGHPPGTLDQLSMKGFRADKYSEVELGWNEYQFVNGYNQFLNKMTQGRERHSGRKLDIRFGQVVEKIKYSLGGVEVTTTDGNVYKAKTAIITASVGVIKSGAITFDPPLPLEKMDALSCLEMGDEAKMVLKFKKRFWPKNTAFLNRVDSKHEMCRTFAAPFPDDDEKNVVMSCLFAGEEADKIKDMSDIEIIKALCRDFDKMFPHAAPVYNLLEVKNDEPTYMRYQWSQNPFTRGADSYLKLGTEKSVPIEKARRKLSLPQTTPGLFWGGEATATGEGIHPGCTHGAHFSGARVAAEVSQHLRLKFPQK